MTGSTDVYLTALAYELGEQEHVLDDLAAVLPGVRASLQEAGLRHYRTTGRTPLELAGCALARTLDAAGEGLRGEIRHVLYATNTAWSVEFSNAAALGDMLTAMGLVRAYPIGLFLSYCANLQASIDVAAALVRSGEADHVLVVCTDKTDPASDRLVQPRISVHSDAAASFLLTRDPAPGSYRLRRTVMRIDPALGAIHPDDRFVEYLNAVSEGVVKVVNDTLTAIGLTPADVAKVFPNNYNQWVSRIVGDLAGFRPEQLYLDNIPRFAHALAADGLINLADWSASAKAVPGDQLLLLGAGPTQWGCTVVEVGE
jgi:3-oxoacyl-[acyl-carrier-protein] synthase III